MGNEGSFNLNNKEQNITVTKKKKHKNIYTYCYLFFIISIAVINFVLALSYLDIHNGTKILKSKVDNLTANDSIELKKESLKEINKKIDDIKLLISNYESQKLEINNKITNIKAINKKLNNELTKKNTEINNKTNTYNSLKKKYKDMTTHIIKNIITYNQYPKYPNGCEAVALYILLKYHNVNVNIDSVMDALPKGKIPYKIEETLYGGDPNFEFLGNPNSITGWGIYDIGLAETANKFKANIINGTGMNFNKIIELVKSNRPVVVWTSINLMDSYISTSWISDKTGETINWKKWNHAVVVIGYNENSIIVSDPIDGKIKYFNKQKFINMYNYMGRRALYY